MLKLDNGMNQCSIYFDDKGQESYLATATHSHWVHYTSGAECQSENFAEYTEGNAIQAFLGGKEYFFALIEIFKQAKKAFTLQDGRLTGMRNWHRKYGWLMHYWKQYKKILV
ncbi:hypothetical protein [Cronobacter malonaticus]|uniref:hypothetical protein n=1 Tax=Cronobacter malonaticus TaxID=413503 RepID=UPI001315A107|nr:hypothetical protein [Cronobacter malonaticus]